MNIPENIIDLVLSYAFSSSAKIPEHIVDKIMLYNSHPVADLFQKEMSDKLEEFSKIRPGDYAHGEEDFSVCDDHSFADYFFHDDEGIKQESKPIYRFAYMDNDYVSTLNEWNRQHQSMIIYW